MRGEAQPPITPPSSRMKTFRHPHRVSYAEVVVGNHVYYARYLDMVERARGEFFRSLGSPLLGLQEQGVIFPVTECHVAYKGAARYDDELEIEIWVGELTRVRLRFEHRIWRGEKVLAEVATHHVSTGLDERPIRMPAGLVEALKPHLRAPEPGKVQ